jgi:uncharacterized protein DUF4410
MRRLRGAQNLLGNTQPWRLKLNRRCLWLFMSLAITSCATAKVADQTKSTPSTALSRPSQIVIYPFAVSPAQVTLNQSIVQRAYRNVSGEDQTASQQQLAIDIASNLCKSVASNLIAKGYRAVCLERGTPAPDNQSLMVDGEFTDISEGNRLRRIVVGFGAGASTLDTKVHVYQRTDSGTQPLTDFTTHADSGKMPGAALMGPAGVAAGGSTAVVVGANVAMGGAKSMTSATGYLADKTATQITDVVTQYYSQQGWSS